VASSLAIDPAGGGFWLRHGRSHREIAVGFEFALHVCDQLFVF
jgi:hypothetical protein